MAICIGSMGRGRFAELDFDHDEAEIFERGERGVQIGPLATVPIASIDAVDDDHDPTLDPESHHTKNLLMFLAADKMIETLRCVLAKLKPRDDMGERDDAEFQLYLTTSGGLDRWQEDSYLVREIEDVLEQVTKVPE